MTVSRRDLLLAGGALGLGAAAAGAAAPVVMNNRPRGEAMVVAAQGASVDDATHHLVNRITWGATPEELDYARNMGYAAYLDEQLNPAHIADNTEAELYQQYPILQLGVQDMARLGEHSEWRAQQAMLANMIYRALFSRRQLYERMVDFWTDHFNLLLEENSRMTVLFHRDTIRPNALGNFRDLLVAVAKSPAMLDYLDNDVNIAESPNENYARELLELHTLGVDGGYTEQDVAEVARVFTGWTTYAGAPNGFFFSRYDHDYGAKTVLGRNLPAERGVEEGLHVLSILANHPSTARYLSRKLCVRFVSDNPPDALVESTAQVWIENEGEIRPVLRHILTSDAFTASVGQKFRRPLEFTIGAARTTKLRYNRPESLYDMLNASGQMPYSWPAPNGYPDVSAAWLNTNGLLYRWNTAMAMTHEAYSSLESPFEADLVIGDVATVGEMVDVISTRVYGAPLNAAQAAAFVEFASDGAGPDRAVTPDVRARKLATLYGLMIASPLYQWR
ncbi:MAG: DUF1800 domain-containing protein, partial [Chloroflexota bacterium]